MGRPSLRGIIVKVLIVTPRKPNSARRPMVKVKLSSLLRCTAYIPGSGHSLRKYSKVYVRGGGARDTPNARYECVRGILDFYGLNRKIRRRSIYAASWPLGKFRKGRRLSKKKKYRLS